MTSNVFKQFERLLPRRPREFGQITAISNDQATVQFPTGGQLRALGASAYQVGDNVFIREGAIEGLAPDLQLQTIEV